jgi:hypothetical protein
MAAFRIGELAQECDPAAAQFRAADLEGHELDRPSPSLATRWRSRITSQGFR